VVAHGQYGFKRDARDPDGPSISGLEGGCAAHGARAIARQKGGRWITSVANAWGVLAMEAFSQQFESREVSGTTSIALEPARETHDWRTNRRGGDLRMAWPAKEGELRLAHQGQGAPWLTVQSYAAVPLKAPFFSGYRIVKRITPVERKKAGSYSRGDVVRVTLEIEAQADMISVALNDPIPAGATILGRGPRSRFEVADRRRGPDRLVWTGISSAHL
jgi:uncharacterized protein YfaS (alpha-2-macroglobulin family)